MPRTQTFAAGLALIALGACAIPNDKAVPDDVIFVGNQLTLYFSNGMVCRSQNVTASSSGTFTDCPLPVRYDVVMAPGHFGTGLTEPYANITVTMPDGRSTLLKTPESRNWTAASEAD